MTDTLTPESIMDVARLQAGGVTLADDFGEPDQATVGERRGQEGSTMRIRPAQPAPPPGDEFAFVQTGKIVRIDQAGLTTPPALDAQPAHRIDHVGLGWSVASASAGMVGMLVSLSRKGSA